MRIFRISQTDIPLYTTDDSGVKTVNPEYLKNQREIRKNDVKSVLLENKDNYMPISDIVNKLSKKYPERWTIFYAKSKEMSQNVKNAMYDLKDEIDVKDTYIIPRGKRGGMGKAIHTNIYKLK